MTGSNVWAVALSSNAVAAEIPGAERALAFAAMTQAAALVHSVANGTTAADSACAYLLQPVLRRDTPPVFELYPAGASRQAMLRQAVTILQGTPQSVRVFGYNIELIELARRLRNHQSVVAKLGSLLDNLPHNDPENAAVTGPDEAELAQIYRQTISTLGRRIQVVGEPAALQAPANANRIRALLLAGVRSAWLWGQLGGRRWQLIFSRRALLQQLMNLEQSHGQ